MKEKVCCFIGHREIIETKKLKSKLSKVIEKLITEENVDTFLFGSKSRFDSLCLELVTKIKEKHPHIKRIYVRAEFPYINDSYKSYLLERYEATYYPETVLGAGKAVYIKRNHEMINNSDFCIFYYDEPNAPKLRKSGTKIALDYAEQQNKNIIMFPEKKIKIKERIYQLLNIQKGL